MEMELLYKNEPPKSKPFPFSHAMAAFDLPEDYRERNLRIVVLDPEKNIIYSAPIPKKRKKKAKTANIALIDKTNTID